MRQCRGTLVCVGLFLLFAVPGEGNGQGAPRPCDSSDCCRSAEGAELTGQVESSESGQPLSGATVEFQVTAPPDGGPPATVTTETDASGAYRLCGIETPARVDGHARHSGATSQSVSFEFEEPGRIEVNFEIQGVPSGPDSVRRGAVDAGAREHQQRLGEYGQISGRVLEADGRRPVGQVDLHLVGPDRRTVTDARGRFRFDSVPAVEQILRVRHLGFLSRELTVDVPAGQILGVTIRLDPEPVALEPLDVQVESELRVPRLAEEDFYYRRELNFGHFFGPQYLTRWSGTRVADVIARTPGFVLRSGTATGRSPRVVNESRGRECQPPVIVDGGMGPGGIWALSAPTSEIAAIEVYKSAAQTVGSLYSGSGCGVILVWTWRGPNPFEDSADGRIACPERLKRFRSHAC